MEQPVTTQNTNQGTIQGVNEDIVTRVNKMETSVNPETSQPTDKLNELETSINNFTINNETLSKIKDPYSRQLIENEHKQMLSGMNKKFQEVAELRKSIEAEKEQLLQNKPKYDVTTREGLQTALKDPEFVKLVQDMAAPQEFNGTQEEWSVLTPDEKNAFNNMQTKINQLEKSQTAYEIQRIDNNIKEKYADYNPTVIDKFIGRVNNGQIGTADLREFVYKAHNYEDAVKRAYAIGRGEINGNIDEKLNASTFDTSSSNQVAVETIPDRGEKSSPQHFREIARKRLAEQQAGKKIA